MEARIIEWKEKSESKSDAVSDFQKMREELSKRNSEKQQLDRIKERINKIPMRFRDKSFLDYQVMDAEQGRIKCLAERYVKTFGERIKEGTSMIFMGRPGTGKTLLSLIIYQELVRKNFSVQYESDTTFVNTMMESRYLPQSQFNSYLDSLRKVQLLIIDEVTESITKTGQLSEPERKTLFKVINDRYENQLCTIIITNRDEHTLRKCIGEPTFDRLSEGGISLAFNWDSYRRK